MLLREIPSAVARRFPNLTDDDVEQELTVAVWKFRHSRGLSWNPGLELSPEEGKVLWVLCWNKCLDLYAGMIRRRGLPRPAVCWEPPPHQGAIYNELVERISVECNARPEILLSLIEGDEDLSACLRSTIDALISGGKSRQVRPRHVLISALAERFHITRKTAHRHCIEVERAVLAVCA